MWAGPHAGMSWTTSATEYARTAKYASVFGLNISLGALGKPAADEKKLVKSKSHKDWCGKLWLEMTRSWRKKEAL